MERNDTLHGLVVRLLHAVLVEATSVALGDWKRNEQTVSNE